MREQEAMVERLKAEVETNLSTITALTGMVEEAQAPRGDAQPQRAVDDLGGRPPAAARRGKLYPRRARNPRAPGGSATR